MLPIYKTKPVLFNAKETLLSLKTDNGKKLCDTPRGMCIVGFIMDIESLISLSKDLLVSSSPIKYLLAYKFSQDHLELFFSAIRQSMRCNNNPNAIQLSFVLRGQLSQAGVQPSLSANCQKLDETQLLSLNEVHIVNIDQTEVICPSTDNSKFENKNKVTLNNENFNYRHYDTISLSNFVLGIVKYIGGFVAKQLVESLTCDECRQAIVQNAVINEPEDVISQIEIKNNGGLYTPSQGLQQICCSTEKAYRRYMYCAFISHFKKLLIT